MRRDENARGRRDHVGLRIVAEPLRLVARGELDRRIRHRLPVVDDGVRVVRCVEVDRPELDVPDLGEQVVPRQGIQAVAFVFVCSRKRDLALEGLIPGDAGDDREDLVPGGIVRRDVLEDGRAGERRVQDDRLDLVHALVEREPRRQSGAGDGSARLAVIREDRERVRVTVRLLGRVVRTTRYGQAGQCGRQRLNVHCRLLLGAASASDASPYWDAA